MRWWSFPKKLKFFSSQPALQETSAEKHAGNRTNEHCSAFSLLAAKNSKDKKYIYIYTWKQITHLLEDKELNNISSAIAHK
jgi:hypothetical protein